ncbi:MAG: putative sugar O-methyltransferase [Proteobacteria bacterium]|nr:putative sugar O-methyltransferase [Pseudomonadota bacterium]
MRVFSPIFVLLCCLSVVSSPVLSMSEPTEFKMSAAREKLDEFLSKQNYKGALEKLKLDGTKAPDEGIALFLLKSNGFELWKNLTQIDQKWVLSRIMKASYNPLGSVSVRKPLEDIKEQALARRIFAFYRSTLGLMLGEAENMWLKAIFEKKPAVHHAIIEGREEDLVALLNDPMRSNLFYGFADPDEPSTSSLYIEDPTELRAATVFTLLQKLAAVVGVRRSMNPECDPTHVRNLISVTSTSAEEMLDALDIEFGFRIDFPNPYPGEVGLVTSRGIASYRSIHALYQAWRCSQLVENCENCKVLEIGAGLGRAAYYAHKFGFKNYTIVDIPMTSIAQAHFLGTVLSSDSITLPEEAAVDGRIRIITPPKLFSEEEKFHLVVNFDGLTEMTREVAMDYWEYAKRNANVFLSVNHEANPYTVRELYMSSKVGKKCVTRGPYALREGYMEEIIDIRK